MAVKRSGKIFLVLSLLTLFSCRIWTIPGKLFDLPGMNIQIPDGTPAFQSGYKDGCSSVLYARGNVYLRSKYDYSFDTKMIGNSEYKSGYSRGWAWCFNAVVGADPGGGTAMGSGVAGRYIYPHGEGPFDTNPYDVQHAWGGFFGSTAPKIVETGSGLDGSFSVWSKSSGGGGSSAFGANPLWSSGEVHFMGVW